MIEHCPVKKTTDLVRVTHILGLSSPSMANTVNAFLKPLETKTERKKVNKKQLATQCQTDQDREIETKDAATRYEAIYALDKETVTEKETEEKATQTEECKKKKKTIEWVSF